MVNAVLYVGMFLPSSARLGGGITAEVDQGFLLAGSNPGLIGIAILALVVLTGTSGFIYFGTKGHRLPSGVGHFASSDIGWSSYHPPRAEGTSYTYLGDGQPGHGSL